MKFRPTYRGIWGVSFPIIIAGISETVVDITDTIFLARYGVTELAAIGLADAIYGVALFITLGLVDGIQIVIGRRAGQEQPFEIGRVFNQGVYMLVLSGVALILLIKLAVPELTAGLFASAEVHAAVNDYLQITAYALLFQAFNLAYSAFYVGIAKTRILIGAAMLLALSNIALDYMLIFGNFGFPELGIEGAAVASLIAEIVAFLFLTLDVLRRRYVATYGLLRFGKWSAELSALLIRISSPISLETLLDMVKWFLFIVIIEQLGEQVLASANIIFSCYALFLILIDSFAETLCSMVSNLIGQHKARQLKLLIRRTIMLSYALIMPLLLVVLLLPEHVLSVFTPDVDMIGASINGLLVIVLVAVIAVPADAFYSAVAGTGDTRAVFAIQLVVTLCTLAYAYVAALYLGLALEYIVVAEAIGWLVCLILSWFWFRSGRWQRLEI